VDVGCFILLVDGVRYCISLDVKCMREAKTPALEYCRIVSKPTVAN